MKVQGRRKRGRPKRRWLDKVKDDIKEKGLSADEVYDRATWRRIHRPQIKVGIRWIRRRRRRRRQLNLTLKLEGCQMGDWFLRKGSKQLSHIARKPMDDYLLRKFNKNCSSTEI